MLTRNYRLISTCLFVLASSFTPPLHAGVSRPAPADPAKESLREGAFETASEVGLATPSTRIAFDRKTGKLTQLVHRASGQEFISRQAIPPLFALTLTNPYETKETAGVSAADFRKVTVGKPGPNKLELTFAGHVSMPLSVQVSATADAAGLVRLRIAVRNTTNWAVSGIQFPQFVMPAQLGTDAANDRLLAPSGSGHARWTKGREGDDSPAYGRRGQLRGGRRLDWHGHRERHAQSAAGKGRAGVEWTFRNAFPSRPHGRAALGQVPSRNRRLT